MGLAIHAATFLVQACKAGVRPDATLTLGRQHMLLSPKRIETILRRHGYWPPPEGAAEFHNAMAKSTWRFDTFAHALGAKRVSSCDASVYEGATLIHDLNQPVPSEWEERFDLIIDGGTLEHVFNFPVAMANCMKMVKTGGHLLLFTPANNYFGHGFYQFSPELFFRVLSPENGFQVQRMIATEEGAGISSLFGVEYPFLIQGPWYEVCDPARIRKRVTLVNARPAALYVLAKKISREAVFKSPPQQSDYETQWQAGVPSSSPGSESLRGARVIAWLRSVFSESFCREVLPRLAVVLDPFRMARFRRKFSLHNREFYQRVND